MSDHVLVVGGSLAGAKVVQGLRDKGCERPVTLLSAEPYLPYDRPPLSKELLAGAVAERDLALLPEDWYDEHDVRVVLDSTAESLDLTRREVRAGQDTHPFGDLVIATGGRARALPGAASLPGVHLLRTMRDALTLREEAERARNVVIVGGGFIGFEVASTLLGQGLRVTVVEAAPSPFARSLDATTAELLVAPALERGVDVRYGVGVSDLVAGSDGRVHAVLLSDGTRLPADLVVVGIGVVPNVEWVEDSGLVAGRDGVHCDATGRAADGVWAVGDVAAWQLPEEDRVERHEHWTATTQQARVVAQNLGDGGTRTCTEPAYVWSDQFGRRINIVGAPHQRDTVHYLSREPHCLAALYTRDGALVGACVVGQPRLMARSRAWVSQQLPLDQVLALAGAPTSPGSKRVSLHA